MQDPLSLSLFSPVPFHRGVDPEESVRPRVPKQLRQFPRAFRDRLQFGVRDDDAGEREGGWQEEYESPVSFPPQPPPSAHSASIGEDLIHINGDRIDFTARSLLAVFRDIDVPAHKLFGPPAMVIMPLT